MIELGFSHRAAILASLFTVLGGQERTAWCIEVLQV